MPPQHLSLTLANGPSVQLHHVPHLKHAAAFLRVHAGSHDVPGAWPGLAHFLEHLLFLGGERFAGAEALMPFVQRNGGQLNASTRERCTDFFFELPPAAFGAGLQRLCDMLAHPCLGTPEQLREREVLHAEFIAWSRDAQARHDFWLIQPLNPAHPLRAFHAGNRYSLPVPNQAFQLALRDFYQGHYQTGQMRLCLVGPQPLEQLQALAEQATTALPAGRRRAQSAPPALRSQHSQRVEARPIASRLDLAFACHSPSAGTRWALDFLATWIASGHPGGLLAELRQRRLAESLRLRTHYHFADQLLVSIEVGGTQPSHDAETAALVFDWLQAFAAQDDWPLLREEFALLGERRQQVAGALQLARELIEPAAESLPALRALLAQLRPQALLYPLAIDSGLAPAASWRSPPGNRFLRPSRRPASSVAWPAAIAWQAGAGGPLASVHLRWRFAVAPSQPLQDAVQRALAGIETEAEQAGVKLRLSCLSREWTLQCSGIARSLASVLASALEVLRQPTASPGPAVSAAPAPMPIRELLGQLPQRLESLGASGPGRSEEEPTTLGRCWAHARWDGLVVGLPDAERDTLGAVLQALPGQALASPALPPARAEWRQVWLPTPSSEHALLLFCLAPADVHAEAAWRLLAQLAQAPFYQRLRGELQLGYAVFSDWRQIGGRGGLLFGVQSPGTPVAQLLTHIEGFIASLPTLIAQLPAGLLQEQVTAMVERFNLPDMVPDRAGELLWQAHLAGRGPDYLAGLQAAIASQHAGLLQAAGRQLINGAHGRLLLSNAPLEAPRWLSQV